MHVTHRPAVPVTICKFCARSGCPRGRPLHLAVRKHGGVVAGHERVHRLAGKGRVGSLLAHVLQHTIELRATGDAEVGKSVEAGG
jgi:hypothetical protein